MDLWYFLMEIFLLLGIAFFMGSVAQRFRQSNIVGYLLAGAILGPLLPDTEAVSNTAEIGVSLLLFSIVLRILADRSEIDSIRGRTSLSILLLQDIAIVPLVMMVTLLSPGGQQEGIGVQLSKLAAASAGLALILYVLLYHIIPKVLYSKGIFPNRDLTVLLAVSIALGSAWFSHTLGISPALGAFIAGIILGESPFATQISADIGSLRIVMVTLFFTSIGMLARPLWMLSHAHLILLGMGGIFIIKVMVTFGVCRLFKLDARHSLYAAITLGQVGEFSFVLATA